MNRKFQHYAINLVLTGLTTLTIVGWIGVVIHLLTGATPHYGF
jgi:preprotein translocase subunit Sss1